MTAKKDEDLLATAAGSRDEGEALPEVKDTSLLEDTSVEPTPEVVAPNQTVPEGKVEIETPAGAKQRKANAPRALPAKAKDPLAGDIDLEKLPLNISVGDVVVSVKSQFGRAIASLSLKGWVGEPEFQIPAEDLARELEPALAELRKELNKA